MCQTIDQIKELSAKIRRLSVEMVYRAKASHIGGALSMADILAVLYSGILKVNASNPDWEERDRFVLSKGHSCTSLYAVLALKGFFPHDELLTYAQNGSLLLSHTSHYIPGVELSAGSLGHALPVCCGLALAAKRKMKDWMTYCIVSDGELDEGSNWESILFAPQMKLDNLVLIVDYNKIQSLGAVSEVIDLYPLDEKFKAFRWDVAEVDGHDHQALLTAFKNLKNNTEKPKVIIAHTIKGKGVSFMEDKLLWHYKSPSQSEFDKAIHELSML